MVVPSRLRVLAALLATVVAALVVLRLSGDSPAPPLNLSQPQDGTALEGTNRTNVETAISRVSLAELGPQRLVVEVRDMQERPITAATLESCISLSPVLEDAQRLLLGRTDSRGVFELRGSPERKAPEFISARAPGFISGLLEGVAWGEHYTVGLVPGMEFHAQVVDTGGAPISGAIVCISRSALPDVSFAPPTSSPGPIESEAIYSAVSDADGLVLIRGLASGDYGFCLSHRDYLWTDVDRQFPTPLIAIPGPTVKVSMSRIVGCYKRLEGATILAKRYSYPFRGHWNANRVRAKMLEQMGSKDDSTICAVSVEGARARQMTLTAEIFVDGEGWREFEWPFKPLSVGDLPDTVVIQSRLTTEGASGTCSVEVRDSGGRILPIGNLRLDSTSTRRFSVWIEAGVRRRVPCGDYHILTSETFLAEVFRDVVMHVDPGENPTVTLTADLVRCRFDFRVPGGRPLIGLAAVIVRRDGAGERGVFMSMTSGGELLMPRGVFSVDVRSQLYGRTGASITIGRSGASPQIITCQVYP